MACHPGPGRTRIPLRRISGHGRVCSLCVKHAPEPRRLPFRSEMAKLLEDAENQLMYHEAESELPVL